MGCCLREIQIYEQATGTDTFSKALSWKCTQMCNKDKMLGVSVPCTTSISTHCGGWVFVLCGNLLCDALLVASHVDSWFHAMKWGANRKGRGRFFTVQLLERISQTSLRPGNNTFYQYNIYQQSPLYKKLAPQRKHAHIHKHTHTCVHTQTHKHKEIKHILSLSLSLYLLGQLSFGFSLIIYFVHRSMFTRQPPYFISWSYPLAFSFPLSVFHFAGAWMLLPGLVRTLH